MHATRPPAAQHPDPSRIDLCGQIERLAGLTADLEPPFAVVDLEAFDANANDLLRRAGAKALRVASKSVRVRFLTERALTLGFRGTLAFSLPEALWLAGHGFSDLVVAYPTVDRSAIASLPHPDVTVMVDCPAHLHLLPAATQVCIDVDAGWWPLGGLVRVGAKRSPVRTPEQAVALAQEIVDRGLVLDGLMSYEAQIAGLADRARHGPLIRAMQKRSACELALRRGRVVEAVRAVWPLRFVNGGGTGSIEGTAAEKAVTEVAAGSGLTVPTLFDSYSSFTPRPAAYFVLPVVRKPRRRISTVLGGGYVASGPARRDRLPRPLEGRLDRWEGAGEVQTPLLKTPHLQLGARVWFRHAKAGELFERFNHVWLVDKTSDLASAPTYRGEGQAFL